MTRAEGTTTHAPEWERKGETVTLSPPLELVDKDALTLQQMQDVCLAVGVDPDAVFREGTAQIPDIPPLSVIEEVFEVVVLNADKYDIPSWTVGQVRAVLAAVMLHFATA